jgi:hypothetical protein
VSLSNVALKVAVSNLLIGASVISADWFSTNITVPIFGAPVTVFTAASIGAVFSLSYQKPIRPKSLLFARVGFCIALGASGSVFAAHHFEVKAAIENPGPFAFLCASLASLFMEAVTQKGKKIISEFRSPFGNSKDQ